MATVLTLAGAFGSPDTGPYRMTLQLAGQVTVGNTVLPVRYNNRTLDYIGMGDVGATYLDGVINATAGPKIVFGHSFGAVVSYRWLKNYGPTSLVDPADLSFVLIGNSVRRYGGYLFAENLVPPADSPYDVLDIANQYDGWADWPRKSPGNVTATVNALAGQSVCHPDYKSVGYIAAVNDVYPSFTEGNIKFVWAPTYPLPMISSPRSIQWPEQSLAEPQPSSQKTVQAQQLVTYLGGAPAGERCSNTRNRRLRIGTGLLAQMLTRHSVAGRDQRLRPIVESAYDRPVTIPDPIYP